MKTLQIKTVALVYQTGIANVFDVSGDLLGNPRRLLQSDFRSCESFARGLQAAGAEVLSWSCNVAGDCAQAKWVLGTSATPFSDKCRPVGEF